MAKAKIKELKDRLIAEQADHQAEMQELRRRLFRAKPGRVPTHDSPSSSDEDAEKMSIISETSPM